MFRTRLRRVLTELQQHRVTNHLVSLIHWGSDSDHTSVVTTCRREPWRAPCEERRQCEATSQLTAPFTLNRQKETIAVRMRLLGKPFVRMTWLSPERPRGLPYGLVKVKPTRAVPPPDWQFEQGGLLISAEGARAILGVRREYEPRVQSQELHDELWRAAHRGSVTLLLARCEQTRDSHLPPSRRSRPPPLLPTHLSCCSQATRAPLSGRRSR